MIVVCPNCSTRFNLPDEQARPGARLRCSVCKHVFPLAGSGESQTLPVLETADEKSAADVVEKSSSGLRNFLILLLVAVILGGVGVLYFAPPASFDPFQRRVQPADDLVSKISFADVRQYSVNNEQAGTLMVIEGKAVNGFNAPRELIRLEASLYNKKGEKVRDKQQVAGNTVSQIQLQVLPEQELESALTNKLGVLTNNTNVAPGSDVPFMIVFYNPPEEVAEFGVKVLEARVPPAGR